MSKNIHDESKESIKENASTPEATTRTGERATTQKLPDAKKVSHGVMPSFQNEEAQDIPRMPRLSPIGAGMRGSTDPLQASFQNADSDKLRRQMGAVRRVRMNPEDREQFDGLIMWLRKDTVKGLEHLIKFDAGISIHGADQLAAALVAIEQADQPNLPGVCLTNDIRLEAANLLSAIFEHDQYLDPFERSDIERTIRHLDQAATRQRKREGSQ